MYIFARGLINVIRMGFLVKERSLLERIVPSFERNLASYKETCLEQAAQRNIFLLQTPEAQLLAACVASRVTSLISKSLHFLFKCQATLFFICVATATWACLPGFSGRISGHIHGQWQLVLEHHDLTWFAHVSNKAFTKPKYVLVSDILYRCIQMKSLRQHLQLSINPNQRLKMWKACPHLVWSDNLNRKFLLKRKNGQLKHWKNKNIFGLRSGSTPAT